MVILAVSSFDSGIEQRLTGVGFAQQILKAEKVSTLTPSRHFTKDLVTRWRPIEIECRARGILVLKHGHSVKRSGAMGGRLYPWQTPKFGRAHHVLS